MLAGWRPSSYLQQDPPKSAAARAWETPCLPYRAPEKLNYIHNDLRQLTSSSCASASCDHRLPGVCGVNHGRYLQGRNPFNVSGHYLCLREPADACMPWIDASSQRRAAAALLDTHPWFYEGAAHLLPAKEAEQSGAPSYHTAAIGGLWV